MTEQYWDPEGLKKYWESYWKSGNEKRLDAIEERLDAIEARLEAVFANGVLAIRRISEAAEELRRHTAGSQVLGPSIWPDNSDQ